jgi:glyoxylase-like metal-dependent hydrolase (beta-lactamase superfamily II)
MVVEMLAQAEIGAKNVAGGMVAYGDYLQPVRVPLDVHAPYELWQVNRRGKGCLSYVIRAGDEAVVVDPARHVAWYQAFAASLGARIVRVLDTHIHADHVSGGPALARLLDVPYSVLAGEGFELRQRVEPLADGQSMTLGRDEPISIEVRVLHTPGHTPGSTSYLVAGRQLLTGDTIFVSSVGRPDLGGHVVEWGAALFETLHSRLADLDDDVVVLPAHSAGVHEMNGEGVVDLRRLVPEMQIPTAEAFIDAVRSAVKEPPASYAQIIRVNLGASEAEPDKLCEWELGKNQCAASVRKAAAHQGGGL